MNGKSCYYSSKLDEIYLQSLPNNDPNLVKDNSSFQENIKNLYELNDIPLNYSELDSFNESFIEVDNVKFELYTTSMLIGSNNQLFKLLLSTLDDYTTIASINCSGCRTSNKFNSLLSNTSISIAKQGDVSFIDLDFESAIFQDQFIFQTNYIQNGNKFRNSVKLEKLNFKVI